MSLLARSQAKTPGWATPATSPDWVWKDNLAALKAKGVKLVTNAGGLNPPACRARMEALPRRPALTFKIAIVEGDDLRPRRDRSPRAPKPRCSPARKRPIPRGAQRSTPIVGLSPSPRRWPRRRRGGDHRPRGGLRGGAGPAGSRVRLGLGRLRPAGRRLPCAATSWSAARRPPAACSPTGRRCRTGPTSAIRSPSAPPTGRSSSPSRRAPAACARRPPSPSRSSTRWATRELPAAGRNLRFHPGDGGGRRPQPCARGLARRVEPSGAYKVCQTYPDGWRVIALRRW